MERTILVRRFLAGLRIAWLATCLPLAAGVFAQAPALPVATPEEVGLDSKALADMFDFVQEHKTSVHSVQLVRHGRLVVDAYFHPFRSGMRHDVASVTKSITSTLVGLAIEQGHLRGVDESVLSFFPSRTVARLDPRKKVVTLEHLLTMQAGWDCMESRLNGMRVSADWVQPALDLPMSDAPGTRFKYCGVNCHLLSVIIGQTTGTNALGFARRELFGPLGILDVAWPADPKGNNCGWSDLQLHPLDMAKLGQMFLQRGFWGERRIVSERWLRAATSTHVDQTGEINRYGYLWWLVGEEFPGAFQAVGRGGQRIIIWPAKDLVLVYTGGGFDPTGLNKFVLQSLKSDKPLTANSNATIRLRTNLIAAARPPAPKPIPPLPALAAQVSRKRYSLSLNSLGLTSFELHLTDDTAEVRFKQLGRDLQCPIGLDDVERISLAATPVELPFAAKGRWESSNTFQLILEPLGGVDCYRFNLQFAEKGEAVGVALSQRSSTAVENIKGVASP